MALFKLNKTLGDIQDPILMEPGWYPAFISKEPKIHVSKESGRSSIRLDLRICDQTGENESYNGRGFTVFLPLPTKEDEGSIGPDGVSFADQCVRRIADWYEAFSGEELEPDQDEIEFQVNWKADVPVILRNAAREGEEPQLVNDIDSFDQSPMPN